MTVQTKDEAVPAIQRAMACDGPVLIDFRVVQEENVYPMVAGGLDLGHDPAAQSRPHRARRVRGGKEGMKHTLVALMEDKPGVLTRVASLFRRRNFNIESLTVGHTEVPRNLAHDYRRGRERHGGRAGHQAALQALNVTKVNDVTSEQVVIRELALIKVQTTAATRGEIIQLAEIFACKIVDVALDSMTIEITGTEDKVESLLRLLRPFGVKEMARTGRVAMVRGAVEGSTHR